MNASLTKRNLVVLVIGALLMAGILTVALWKQPEYSSLFVEEPDPEADTALNEYQDGENMFPDAPVLAEPRSHPRKPRKEVPVLLPEIELEDPVADIVPSKVEHPTPREEIFTKADRDAKPLDGMSAFTKKLHANLKYPVQAHRLKVEGVVRVEFIVEKDGAIREVKVVKGIGAGCDEEAVRLVSSSPPWSPALISEKPVRQRRWMSVEFELDRKDRKR